MKLSSFIIGTFLVGATCATFGLWMSIGIYEKSGAFTLEDFLLVMKTSMTFIAASLIGLTASGVRRLVK